MTSGDTNSGEPYLLYCGSEGVIFWANPKSQILMSSRAGCTIRMLGGCQAELGGYGGLRFKREVAPVLWAKGVLKSPWNQ